MSAHTPGPWAYEDGGYEFPMYSIGPKRNEYFIDSALSYDWHDITGKSQEVAEANARLAASAPELLAKLIEVAGCCAECNGLGVVQGGIGGPSPPCPDCADLRDLIAKAGG